MITALYNACTGEGDTMDGPDLLPEDGDGATGPQGACGGRGGHQMRIFVSKACYVSRGACGVDMLPDGVAHGEGGYSFFRLLQKLFLIAASL